MGSKGGGATAQQTAAMEEMLGMAKDQVDYFKPQYEDQRDDVFGTYGENVYEQIPVLDTDPDSATYGEQLINPDGSPMTEDGRLISRGELIKDGRIQEFEQFEFTNPFADLTNPYADIRTDFDNPASGMTSVAEGFTNVAADAIDPSAGMTNAAAGAQNMYANMRNQFAGMENAYAGLENQYEGMENVFEDATVDTQAAEFQAQQVAQQQANIMQGLRGAAGSSGIAALAQTMANQGQLQAQQASAGIAQQERQNQMMQMQEASRLQQLERGEAARLQSQAAQGAMAVQQQERAGAARVQEQMAAGAMSAQQQRIAGASQLQNLQFQGAAEQQRQFLSGAQALQDAQLKANAQLQNLQFQGDQWANEMNIAQENLMAQGAWATDIAAAQGAAAVQQAEFGQLSSILGMEMGQLAGLQGAFTGAQGNQMAGMGSMAEMFGSQAAAQQSMWPSDAGTAAMLTMAYMGMPGSDRDLKKNIKKIGKSKSGVNIYEFEYKDPSTHGAGVYQGVIADDLPKELYDKAVIKDNDKNERVDYSKLDVEFKKIKDK